MPCAVFSLFNLGNLIFQIMFKLFVWLISGCREKGRMTDYQASILMWKSEQLSHACMYIFIKVTSSLCVIVAVY